MLVLAAALLPCCAVAQAPQHLWARNDYPIPADRPGRLFFLQRSMNPSTVVYEARMLPGGGFDPDRPVDAYWLRSRAAVRRPLDFVEQHMAFGPVVKRDPAHAGTWIVHAAGYAGRSARLVLDPRGNPALVGVVAGREARLVSAYLELDGTGYMPRVLAIDLYGIDTADGAWLHERFTP